MDEVDKILNDYTTIYNKNYDSYFFNRRIKLEPDNNFTMNIETNYFQNIESRKINNILLYAIKCLESMGYKLCWINQMNISVIFDKCNITFENYINNPVDMIERRVNINFAKNPELIYFFDRNINLPLVRKFSHIHLNN